MKIIRIAIKHRGFIQDGTRNGFLWVKRAIEIQKVLYMCFIG